MGGVIGQRWEIYDYGREKERIPKRGELVCINNTPEFGTGIILLIADGSRTILGLYEGWKSGEASPYGIDASMLKKTDVVNNLTGSATDKPLSANQGRLLNINKANLASPTFTGTPKVPSKTTAAKDDGTLIATEAQVLAAQLATQTWLAAVQMKANLPSSGLNNNINYLCRVIADSVPASNGVYQRIAGQSQWTRFSDNQDWVDEAELAAALEGKLDVSRRGAANGVASLDGLGKVPSGQLPNFVTGGNTKAATVVIGTSPLNAAEVDVLCTGSNAHTAINSAIAALPSGGGKIIIREGTYNLGGSINVNRDNVTLEGMGPSTVLGAASSIPSGGVINVTGSCCVIAGLKIINNPSAAADYAVTVRNGNRNRIEGNTFSNTAASGNCWGVYIESGSHNRIEGNTFSNANASGNCWGVYIESGSHNRIEGNTFSNASGGNGDCWGAHIESGSHNRIEGNTFSNTAGGNGGSYGVCISGGKYYRIAENTFANNGFALWIIPGDTFHYGAVYCNNLCGVTGAGYTMAFTGNGSTSTPLPGSPAAAGWLYEGMCGFNIV